MSEHIEALKEHLERKGLKDWETEARVTWIKRENAELRRDKERLDWLLENASIAHVCWSIDSREQIDEAMKEEA